MHMRRLGAVATVILSLSAAAPVATSADDGERRSMMAVAYNGEVGIAYEVEGDGPPLVLLHGFTETRASWRDHGYAAALIRAGRRIVLIDLRGHGESDRPSEPEAYTLSHRTADVIAVLDALDVARADLWGYSMGGWIALGLIRDHPDRVRAAIVGGAHPYAQSMAFYREAIAGGIDAWLDRVESAAGAPLAASAGAAIAAGDLAALRAAVADDRGDMSAEVARADVPLLLYAGTADPVHPPARRFAEESGAVLVDLPDQNHVQARLRSDLILERALAFLAAVDACER